jgi:hypothetical protein
MPTLQAELQDALGDRYQAHRVVFKRRHEHEFAPYHRQLVEDFWSDVPALVTLAFRGGGKSTLAEEYVALAGGLGLFRNCIIIGSSEARAAERLAAISNEMKTNETYRAAIGDQVGEVWTQTKLVLRNGAAIQAMGRDQDIRGIKHLDWRPDLVLVDDFEDKDNVQSPEGRRRTLRWFLAELRPACDPRHKVRVLATPMNPESVPMQLINRARWPSRVVPILHLDAAGRERPSWPEGFPMAWIEDRRREYAALGEIDLWESEYMVNPVSAATRVFRPEHFKVEPQVRAWQAVYAMIDPARTARRTSATTGWAVWSWVRNRLIVWEAGAKYLLPDEIVDLAFRIYRDYGPVEVGVEEDGLNEWLLQPIRSRMLKDGVIPYRAVRAPKGKIDFIRGLQPFFAAGEVVMAGDMPELREQLLGFPTGRIDAPNALAYALLLKPGRLIYEGWNPNAHIEAGEFSWARPAYLACNATRTVTGAALVQCYEGRTAVLHDVVSEGGPDEVLEGIVREASLAAAGAKLTMICGRQHWEQYANVGLVQAARSLGVDVRPAGDPARGREFMRRELGRAAGNGPCFSVSPAARWTLNAFAGGYSRPLRDGSLAGDAEDNHYRVLMEGLEAFAGLLAFGVEDDDEPGNYAYSPDGRRYRSALPARMQTRQ